MLPPRTQIIQIQHTPFLFKVVKLDFCFVRWQGRKPSSSLDVLPPAPTCCRHFLVSLNHLTVSAKDLWANISRGEIIYSSRSRKTVNIPGCLAGSGSFNDAITATARHGYPALTDKSNVHQINRGSRAIEWSISLCWSQVYCSQMRVLEVRVTCNQGIFTGGSNYFYLWLSSKQM